MTEEPDHSLTPEQEAMVQGFRDSLGSTSRGQMLAEAKLQFNELTDISLGVREKLLGAGVDQKIADQVCASIIMQYTH